MLIHNDLGKGQHNTKQPINKELLIAQEYISFGVECNLTFAQFKRTWVRKN